MNDSTNNQSGGHVPPPDGHYWDDPVYRYVSRQHRSAVEAGDDGEASRLDRFMQQLAGGTMAVEVHDELTDLAAADRRRRRAERKRHQSGRPPEAAAGESRPSVNVADLKRRIYNPNVSRDNIIKALESLPSSERKAVIAGLPPGLRRKLGDYLKGRG